MRVYIVVLNYNGREDTLACLQSLEKVELPKEVEMEILVVDNGSKDGSVEAIKSLKNESIKARKQERDKINKKKNNELPNYYKLQLITNDSNLGYAAGNNVGIRYALDKGADYVLVLNNDTKVDSLLLKELLAGAKRHPKAGMLAPKVYFANGMEFHKDRYEQSELGRVIWAAGGRIDWDNVYGVNIGIDEVDMGQFGEEKRMEKAPGTCVLMRREMFESVGVFDEKFFMYHEDDDLSVRVKKAGWEVWYIPRAKIWHVSGGASGVGSSLMDYFTTRNRLLFGMRYARWRTKLALVRESVRL